MKLLIHSGFLASYSSHPDRPALEVRGRRRTYRELGEDAAAIAAVLGEGEPSGLTAVFAYRSLTAFTGVLGALLRGHGYVPLNRTFPTQRTAAMLKRSGCRAVIVDEDSAPQLEEALAGNNTVTTLVAPESDDPTPLRERFPSLTVFGRTDLPAGAEPRFVPRPPEDIAYLLFTSGSTGDPKGVMVSHANACSFLDWAHDHYGVTEEDRLSQMFDMTFDLSVFDMFVAWGRGACLCCPSPKELIQPGRFIREQEITIWFSVPSTGVFMRRLGALKPGRYPSLRWSLFCGEPLPVDVAQAWQEAAPNSTVENLYGPTEATIACTVYRWDPETSPDESVHGVVPIGEPFGGMAAHVMDEQLVEVPVGQPGELYMSGPQITPGYWRDPARTADAYVKRPNSDIIHYRTGDRVQRITPDAPLVYLGRVDHQIQILGHRVELGEVEAVLREASGENAVIALGWPLSASGASGVVAFIGNPGIDLDRVRAAAEERLPDYMVPRDLHLRDRLPLNSNGKFDRKALMKELEDMP